MLSQKEAVYQVVTSLKQPDGNFDRREAIDQLFKLFKNNQVNPTPKGDDKALTNYCGSVLSNWLRKDERLGGTGSSLVHREGKKKPKPADDELKRLTKAKVVLKANGQPTDEIDQKISERDLALKGEQETLKADTERDALALLATLNL